MDLALDIADDYVFDSLYKWLLPVSLFESQLNASAVASHMAIYDSKWSQVVARIPHPPLVDILSQVPDSDSLSIAHNAISAWPRDYVLRQCISLSIFTMVGIHVLYFLFAGLAYYFIFNHEMMRHPRFLKNQVKLEIQSSVKVRPPILFGAIQLTSPQAFPLMMALMFPFFLGEVRGYSKLYAGSVEGVWDWTYLVLSVPA